MLETIQSFFASVINAQFDFAQIWESIVGTYYAVICSPTYIEIEAFVKELLVNVPGVAVTAALLVLSLIQLFAGKKLLNFQKFVACFVLGFAYGVVFLAPLVETVVPLPYHWISGVVVGVIAALLCKPVYFVGYVGAAAYAAYFVCFSASVLPELTAYTQGNMVYSLVAAAVAVVLVLIFRKWIEMIGTSVLGAWCTYLCVDTLAGGLANIEALAPSIDIVMWASIAVVALIGFIVQVKTRRRY